MLPEGIEDMILFPNRHDPDLEPDESLPAFVISRLTAEAVMQVRRMMLRAQSLCTYIDS